MRGDIEQVTGIEADIQRLGPVLHFDFFGRAAGIWVGHGQHEFPIAQRQLDCAAALTRDGGDTVHRLFEHLFVDREFLVIADRNDAHVVRKCAIDQLGGEHRLGEPETDLTLG